MFTQQVVDPNRYPKRNIKRVFYKEAEDINDDDFLCKFYQQKSAVVYSILHYLDILMFKYHDIQTSCHFFASLPVKF